MRLSKTAPFWLACAVVAASPAARAAPIVYTVSDFLRLTIGASSQMVGTLTLSQTADTSTVTTPASGVFVNPGTVTFSFNGGVSGIFTGTFTDPMEASDNQNTGQAGFVDTTLVQTVLETNNPTSGTQFNTYDLTTLLGPVSGRALVGFGVGFPTTAGTLTLDSSPQDINLSTFTASVVSEPATLTLLAAGLLSLAPLRRRRSR
jgi:hypothetical protein